MLGDKLFANASSLILYIRGLYCDHAVETKSQQEYVADVCNMSMGENLFPPVSKPSWPVNQYDDIKVNNYWGDNSLYEEDNNVELPSGNELVTPMDEDVLIPNGFDLVGCKECGHFEWYSEYDEYDIPTNCPVCASIEYVDVTDAIDIPTNLCIDTDLDCSHFAMSVERQGYSKYSLAKDAGKNTKACGDIQCSKCKRYRVAEFINEKGWTCIACEKKGNKKKGNKKKGKSQMTLKQFGKNKYGSELK